MEHLRCFVIKYYGATNTKGSRLKITDTRFNKSIFLSFSYGNDWGKDQAVLFLRSKKIEVSCMAWNETTGEDYLLTDNFETQIK